MSNTELKMKLQVLSRNILLTTFSFEYNTLLKSAVQEV
jgi:hypothetical protein